jgi:luciferase-like monooxygenase
MAHGAVLIDEIANELDTWPGVRIERRADGAAVVRYEEVELGVLHREPAMAEVRVSLGEREDLVEHGEAEPDGDAPDSRLVTHAVEGPADVTAALELFDGRYRDVRGEDAPYSSQDPD